MEFWGLTLTEISAILAILGVIALWLKRTRVLLKRAWDATLGRRTAQLNRIEQELLSNGGTSIKDALRRIEIRLSEIDAFQRTALNIHDVAVIRWTSEGKVIAINREYQHLTGASIAEMKGDGWINSISPKYRDEIIHRWAHAVKDKREFHEDIEFISMEGKTFIAHVNVYRELDSLGNVRGYLGVVIPIQASQECPYKHRCFAHKYLEEHNLNVKDN